MDARGGRRRRSPVPPLPALCLHGPAQDGAQPQTGRSRQTVPNGDSDRPADRLVRRRRAAREEEVHVGHQGKVHESQ